MNGWSFVTIIAGLLQECLNSTSALGSGLPSKSVVIWNSPFSATSKLFGGLTRNEGEPVIKGTNVL